MARNSIFTAALAAGVALAALSSAAAATSPKKISPEQILYYFQGGGDGGVPNSTLIADQAGNLYGTTEYGGNLNCTNAPLKKPPGCGTVFKIAPDGTETVLHAFSQTGGDGIWPVGYLSADSSGNLYGALNFGPGTIYKVTPDGVETILYSSNGSLIPTSGLVFDSQGNLYGASFGGGKGCGGEGCGYIYKLAPNGALTVVHSFTNTDGADPMGALVMDSSGDIYGTTEEGGAKGWGALYKLTPDGTESVLYSFGRGPDAAQPQSGVVMDAQGNLYGTSPGGGSYANGAVFKVTPAGAETILLDCQNRLDGLEPLGTPVVDASGNVYGTTYYGGIKDFGTVFKITPDGAETVLFNFKKDVGDYPISGLILDASGNLYGATGNGGNQTGRGSGVVFKLTQ